MAEKEILIMAIQTLADTGTNIPFAYDGAVYGVGCPDGVVAGVGDEFAVNYSASSLSITFEAGSQAVVGGQFFHVTEAESVLLPNNSDGYICAEIDVSQTVGSTGSFQFLPTAAIKRENINGNGTIHDVPLYRVQTGTSGVITVTDVRTKLSVPHAKSYCTWAEYNAMPYHSDMVDYIIFEEQL